VRAAESRSAACPRWTTSDRTDEPAAHSRIGGASASNGVGEASRCRRWVEQAVGGRVRGDGAGLARITLIPVSVRGVGGRVRCGEPGGGGSE
jgi:hypothetical protein